MEQTSGSGDGSPTLTEGGSGEVQGRGFGRVSGGGGALRDREERCSLTQFGVGPNLSLRLEETWP